MAVPHRPPEQIMVVDDDPAARLLLERVLGKAGFVVHLFEDGAQAIAAAARVRPVLVLSDINMPGLSGFSVVERLRLLFPELPIIMMTNDASATVIREAFCRGANAFLVKPFESLDAVLGKVDSTLQAARQRAAITRSLGQSATRCAGVGERRRTRGVR